MNPWSIATNRDGNLLARVGGDRLRTYTPTGTLVNDYEVPWDNFVVGAHDNRVYGSLSETQIGVFNMAGEQVGSIAQAEDVSWNSFDITPDGRLVSVGYRRGTDRSVAHVQSLDGSLIEEFELSNSGYFGRLQHIAVSNDHLYFHNEALSTLQRLSLDSGDLVNGRAVPQVRDLAYRADGSILAAMPFARVVEQITDARFAPDYVGVTRFFDRPPRFGSDLDALDNAGIGRDNRSAENDAGIFIVPGEPGEMVELTFRGVSNYGINSRSQLGVYFVDEIETDPLQDLLAYKRETVEKTQFTISANRPIEAQPETNQQGAEGHLPALGVFAVEAGTEIGFAHFNFPVPLDEELPEGSSDATWRDRFLTFIDRTRENGDSDATFRLLTDGLVAPFVSDPAGNYDGFDQFAFFLGEDSTAIFIESDYVGKERPFDLTDFVVTIDARLIPTPEPCTAVLSLLSLQTALATRRWRS